MNGPLGVLPSSDSEINILTPNYLLLERSLSINPGGWSNNPSYRNQLGLITEMANRFWNHWTELYAPTLIKQTKWHRPDQNLKVGDIVAVADQNSLREKYHIAKVAEVFPGKDGKVRKVTIVYKTFKQGEKCAHIKVHMTLGFLGVPRG